MLRTRSPTRSRPRCRIPALLCATLLGAGTTAAAPAGIRILAYEPLTLPAEALPRAPARGKPGLHGDTPLAFDGYGRRFILELEPNDRVQLFAANASASAFRGVLAREPGSWARITRAPSGLHGLIWDGAELYVVSPGEDVVDALVPPLERPGDHVLYRLRDTLIEDPAPHCVLEAGEPQDARPGDEVFAKMIGELGAATDTARATTPARAIELSLLGDTRLAQYAGSDAHARDEILTRLNNVDGIYVSQLGVALRIASLEVLAASSDPFTATTDPSALLRELSSFRERSTALRATGLTHLFTARDLEGDTVGVAYLGALCDARLGAAITEMRGRTAFYESLITAHEIGHNFGAPHDGEDGPCRTTPTSFLMAPRINGSDTFSVCSLDQILPRIAAAACIGVTPSLDLAAIARSASARLALERTTTVGFAIVNRGGASAMGARATITTGGPEIELVAAGTQSGSCNIVSVSSASCELGDLPRDRSVDVAVDVAGRLLGTGLIEIAASAAGEDGDPSNDAVVTPVSVEEAADLVLTAAGATAIDVNTAVELPIGVENRSDLPVTNLVVTARIPGGLLLRDATVTGGTCSVAAGGVTCEQSRIDARRTTTVQLALTGVAAGTHQIEVAVAADQLDLTPADNSATLPVIVRGATQSASSSGAGGGGGGGGLGSLSVLLLLLASRRKRCFERPAH